MPSSSRQPLRCARRDDGYVALDKATGVRRRHQHDLVPRRDGIDPGARRRSHADPERMPAWVAGRAQLGFVRTTGGSSRACRSTTSRRGCRRSSTRRSTSAADAPTPQTRAFQSSWGGLSIAESSALDVPVVTCNDSCLLSLQTSIKKARAQADRVDVARRARRSAIFVVRVTGKRRKLLGRTVPRIKQVGRVPLGKTDQGPQPVPLERRRCNGAPAEARASTC